MNEHLADILGQLTNILNANQTPGPNTNSRGTKAHIPDTFSGTEPNKLNNFLFQCHLYFCANLEQFDMCYGTLWTLTFFFFFYLFFLILYFFSFEFLFIFIFILVTMKRHVTSQSQDMSHDVTS